MSNISSIRSGSSGDQSGKVDRPNRPQGQPRNDNFRKISKDPRSQDKDASEIETDEDAPEEPPRSLFDLSRSNAKSKGGMAKPKADTSSTMRTPGETMSTAEPEGEAGDQDLTALTAKKSPSQTQMPGRAEPKDTRLFENVLAKTTDEVPTDELSGKEIGEGKEGKKLASNELGRQQADQVQAMKSDRDDAPSGKAEKLSAALKKDKSKKTESDEAEKEGRTKLAAANASIQGAGLGSDKAALKDTAEVSRTSTIRDIAAQIVEKVQIMKDSDTTRTIVTLRHPPILAGATVTLIVSDNAKNELNISFANLSPDAKMFLDRKLNEDSLTQTLERKGIVVHMITTKTEAENLNLQGAQPTREDQQQQQREQSQQQQQRERERQEEEENG